LCRTPKVLIVAPPERHAELRSSLSSLEYDIVATVGTTDEASAVSADVAMVWEPDEEALLRLRELGLKTVAIGGEADTADMTIDPSDVASFKTRIWELFRPS
jgi:hypothetical protein